MAATAPVAGRPPADAEQVLRALEAARSHMLALVAHLDDEQLQRVHSPIMSPLSWDLGHVAAYEDLWLAHRHGGLELLRGDLAEVYDAFETPRAVRGEVAALGPAQAREYMVQVRARTTGVLSRQGIGDGFICEMVVRHELQHTETMRQTLDIAGLLPQGEPALVPILQAEGWIELPAGEFQMGAPPARFAYDNELPRHPAETGAFAIARCPVSNEGWIRFVQDGGYRRRKWWSEAGWAWKDGEDKLPHPSITAGPPDAPACHISWFEAEAYAAAHGARLPTEAEWERAATLAAGPGAHALAAVGQVWEWTQSAFCGYPGFSAHPYREYSEVFFGERYRVLRGGSWATHRRVAGPTFRNWDLPQRRQIFSGVRLARDLR